MNNFKKLSFVSIIMASLTAPALADNFNVGVTGSWAYLEASGKNTFGSSSKTATDQANFGFGSIFAEYSKTYSPSTEIVFGLDYVPFKAEMDARSKTDSDLVSGDSSTTGTNKIKVDLKNHATLYIQPTYKISNDSAWFFKLGYAQADVNASGSSVSGSTIDKKDTMSGPVVGLGAQTNINKDMFVRFEINYADYEEVSFTNSGGAKVTADPKMYSAKISLAKRF